MMMSIVVLSLLALPLAVGAQNANGYFGNGNFGNPTGGGTDLIAMIQSIIQIILGFLGIIAVLIILWGGFIWMTAAGDPDKVDKAKKMIYSGIIGLVIIFAAYAIAYFVINSLVTATNATL